MLAVPGSPPPVSASAAGGHGQGQSDPCARTAGAWRMPVSSNSAMVVVVVVRMAGSPPRSGPVPEWRRPATRHVKQAIEAAGRQPPHVQPPNTVELVGSSRPPGLPKVKWDMAPARRGRAGSAVLASATDTPPRRAADMGLDSYIARQISNP